MKIFCIDSTSYVPRVAIVDNGNSVYEKQWISSGEKWNNMVWGDASYLIDDFFELIQKIEKDIGITVKDCDLICYSWYSWFRTTMNLWKILAKSLSIQFNVEMMCVDHITAHYFSQFTQNIKKVEEKDYDYPILFFSASWSHNSIALLKNLKELTILHDKTYFDEKEKKFLGLGSIYFRACKICKILDNNEWTDKISDKLHALDCWYDQQLVDEFIHSYNSWGIFDMNFQEILFILEDNITLYENNYDLKKVFCSFEEAIFQIIERKLKTILYTIPCRQISIVWGISQNDNFFNRIQWIFGKSWVLVTRPDSNYRFDNASMLGTLAFYIKENAIEYPISRIVT